MDSVQAAGVLRRSSPASSRQGHRLEVEAVLAGPALREPGEVSPGFRRAELWVWGLGGIWKEGRGSPWFECPCGCPQSWAVVRRVVDKMGHVAYTGLPWGLSTKEP